MSAVWERRREDGHVVSTDRARIDFDRVHRWIAGEYWASGIDRALFRRSLESALCFGLHAPGGEQIGFARAISDFARFAWISDLVVERSRRGAGLGVFLAESVLAHPDLAGVRRWGLNTRDAQGLYARFGFVPAPDDMIMLRESPP